MTFENLNLHPQLLKALAKAGYTNPTQIQAKAIPKILAGFDIRASAQTGTGKTAAFLLPALDRLIHASEKPGKGPRVLVLAPTRELAMQIAGQADKYKEFLPHIKTVCVSGGVPYHTHLNKLARPYDILIATPGRLIDYMGRNIIDFSRLELLVLDEADRMLDMGFLDPVEEIVAETPPTRQTLLFSATLKGEVVKLSERLLKKPMDISVHSAHEKNVNIEQRLYYVNDRSHKNRLLEHILKDDSTTSTIIFTSTKRNADDLVEELLDNDHQVAALHGDMNQRQRTRTIAQLKDGRINVLVATDVAARGIDIQSISHVINYDLPRNIEDYVHRIGRTGRAGAQGIALSFATGREGGLVKRIEGFTGQPINVLEIEGLEPAPMKKSSPKDEGPRSRSKSRSGGFGSASRGPRSGGFGSKSRGPRSSEFGSKSRGPRSSEFGDKSERPRSSGLGKKPGRPRSSDFDDRPKRSKSSEFAPKTDKPRSSEFGDRPKRPRSDGFGFKPSGDKPKFLGFGEKSTRRVKPSGFGPKPDGERPRSGGFGAKSGGFGAKSGGFGARSGGFGAKSGGFGAKSGGFGAKSGGRGKPSGFGPKVERGTKRFKGVGRKP